MYNKSYQKNYNYIRNEWQCRRNTKLNHSQFH